jgi:hypothetical protein
MLLTSAGSSPGHAAPARHSELPPAAERSGSRKRRRPDVSSAATASSTAFGENATLASAADLDLRHPSAATHQDQEWALPPSDGTDRATKVQRLGVAADAATAAAAAACAAAGAAAAAVRHTASGGAGPGASVSRHSDAPEAPAPSAAEEPSADWRRLYASSNGWKAPRFHQWHFPPEALKVMVGTTPLYGVAGHQRWHRTGIASHWHHIAATCIWRTPPAHRCRHLSGCHLLPLGLVNDARSPTIPLRAVQVPYDFVSSLDVAPAAAAGLATSTEDVLLLACSDRIDAFETGADCTETRWIRCRGMFS